MHRHHAQAEQVHFDDAHVGAIFFVPLHHHAAGHGGGLERHDGIELPLADDHAARMLAEMPRQILHALAEIEVDGNLRMGEVEAGAGEMPLHRVVRIAPLPAADHGRQTRERVFIEAKHFAHFARGRASAIGETFAVMAAPRWP